MLVLSRKKSEQIVIDHEIGVTVISIRGGKVRLGLSAPEDVTILQNQTLNTCKPLICSTVSRLF